MSRLGGFLIVIGSTAFIMNGIVVGWTMAHSWPFDVLLVLAGVIIWRSHRKTEARNRAIRAHNARVHQSMYESWAIDDTIRLNGQLYAARYGNGPKTRTSRRVAPPAPAAPARPRPRPVGAQRPHPGPNTTTAAQWLE